MYTTNPHANQNQYVPPPQNNNNRVVNPNNGGCACTIF